MTTRSERLTFKRAPKAATKAPEKKRLDFDSPDDTDEPF
jgi:hypothetical protein